MNARVSQAPVANVRRPKASEPPPRARASSAPVQNTPADSKLARRFLGLWAVAVLATGFAFVVHLALRFETIRLGYEVGAARREQRQLIEQRRLLSLEAATLKQPARVETIARGSLGMSPPEAARIVPMRSKGGTRSAGRAR